tara:strand:- start:13 stop:678 length:666 start_codon:yes stop_codon:yes gene_type:complete
VVLPELEAIKKKRMALGLSQEKLATELTLSGVKLSRVVINRIENRKPKKKKYSPSYDVVKSIFDYLEIQEGNEMKIHKQAGEICVSPLVTVSSEETIESAKKKMGTDGQITQLPVMNEKVECIGLVTSNSILNKSPGAKLVREVTEPRPPIISEDMYVTPQVKALLDDSPCILVSGIDTGKIKGIIVAWDLISKNRANTWKFNKKTKNRDFFYENRKRIKN